MSNPVHVLNPLDRVRALYGRMAQEIGHRVVGQGDTVAGLIAGLMLGGHVLMEGVPGVGKTLLAKTLAEVVGLKFARIQFTPDLMPADILGTHLVSTDPEGRTTLKLHHGPLFANVVLADEINRASPKTQSALLEAMQERQVSLGDTTYPLPNPYFVVATQNPIEQEGTYPLPEAQLDRFLMKLQVRFPTEDEIMAIVDRTAEANDHALSPIADARALLDAGRAIRSVPVAETVARYATRLVLATHPDHPNAPKCVPRFVSCGASPRAAQSVVAVAKFLAMLDGRFHVSVADVQRAALPCLRHRIILNFDAHAEGIGSDSLINQIMAELGQAGLKK